MSTPAEATRNDPYGEFSHLKPVALEEATRSYRSAKKTQRAATELVARLCKEVREAQSVLNTANRDVAEATYLLDISITWENPDE